MFRTKPISMPKAVAKSFIRMRSGDVGEPMPDQNGAIEPGGRGGRAVREPVIRRGGFEPRADYRTRPREGNRRIILETGIRTKIASPAFQRGLNDSLSPPSKGMLASGHGNIERAAVKVEHAVAEALTLLSTGRIPGSP